MQDARCKKKLIDPKVAKNLYQKRPNVRRSTNMSHECVVFASDQDLDG